MDTSNFQILGICTLSQVAAIPLVPVGPIGPTTLGRPGGLSPLGTPLRTPLGTPLRTPLRTPLGTPLRTPLGTQPGTIGRLGATNPGLTGRLGVPNPVPSRILPMNQVNGRPLVPVTGAVLNRPIVPGVGGGRVVPRPVPLASTGVLPPAAG